VGWQLAQASFLLPLLLEIYNPQTAEKVETFKRQHRASMNDMDLDKQ